MFRLAFHTPTGMPYGTVNLLRGVNPTETPITCTAGVGTFILEFSTLSHLTGDPVFEDVARKALAALWKTRSDIGLVRTLPLEQSLAIFGYHRLLTILLLHQIHQSSCIPGSSNILKILFFIIISSYN